MPTYLGVDPDPQIIVKTGGPGPSIWDSNFLNLQTEAESQFPPRAGSTGPFWKPLGQASLWPPLQPFQQCHNHLIPFINPFQFKPTQVISIIWT